MRSTTINGILITEGSKYRHLTTNCIYEVIVTREGNFKFDNGIISRSITPERLAKVEEVATCY